MFRSLPIIELIQILPWRMSLWNLKRIRKIFQELSNKQHVSEWIHKKMDRHLDRWANMISTALAPIINLWHYNDVIMGVMASQITSLTIVYSTVYSGADQRKHQSSASLAFVWGIHRGPLNSPHKWPVTRKMFPFDDIIMEGNRLYSTPFLMSFMNTHIHL